MCQNRKFSLAIESQEPQTSSCNRPINAFLVSSLSKTQSLPDLHKSPGFGVHRGRMYSLCDTNNINQINDRLHKHTEKDLNPSAQSIPSEDVNPEWSNFKLGSYPSISDCRFKYHHRRKSIAVKFMDPREVDYPANEISS